MILNVCDLLPICKWAVKRLKTNKNNKIDVIAHSIFVGTRCARKSKCAENVMFIMVFARLGIQTSAVPENFDDVPDFCARKFKMQKPLKI